MRFFVKLPGIYLMNIDNHAKCVLLGVLPGKSRSMLSYAFIVYSGQMKRREKKVRWWHVDTLSRAFCLEAVLAALVRSLSWHRV